MTDTQVLGAIDRNKTPAVQKQIGFSEADSTDKIFKKKKGCFPFGNQKPKRKKREYTSNGLEDLKAELIQCCLTHMQDTYRVHLNRVKGLKILNSIICKAKLDDVNNSMAAHMTWSCLSCIHHFLLRLNTRNGLLLWARKKQAREATTTYDKMLRFLLPEMYSVILSAIITFCEEANLWDIESLCSNLLKRLLLLQAVNFSSAIDEVITLAEHSSLTCPSASRQIIMVLYDIERSVRWTLLDQSLILRFMDIYYKSINVERYKEYNYNPIQEGLEMCILDMATTLEGPELMFMLKFLLKKATLREVADENLLEFGNLVEHIGALYSGKSMRRSLPDAVFPYLLKLIASEDLLYSLLGNRVLHHLIDRHNNRLNFETPRIFFRDAYYDIGLNEYNAEDREFFRRHRENLHSTILTSIATHGTHRVHLECTYLSLALLLVEVPCGYTAAAAVCLTMALQEYALQDDIEMINAHRIHATVLAVLSLVCYIHTAEVFYDYILTVIERRAQYAPQLNPPLKSSYKYAQHHILWNSPELFFEDWESRYGLWKCFRSKQGIAEETGTVTSGNWVPSFHPHGASEMMNITDTEYPVAIVDVLAKNQKFMVSRRNVTFKFNIPPKGVDFLKWLRVGIDAIVLHITANVNFNDKIGFDFGTKDNAKEAHIAFPRADTVTADDTWGMFGKIYQSNSEGLNTDRFCLGLTYIKLPKETAFSRRRRNVISRRNSRVEKKLSSYKNKMFSVYHAVQ